MTSARTRAEGLDLLPNYFRQVVVLAIGVLPLARPQPPLDVHQSPLRKVLAREFCPLTEQHHAMPLGLFLPSPGAVLANLRGCHTQVNHRLVVRSRSHLRISPEVSDQLHLVQGCHMRTP